MIHLSSSSSSLHPTILSNCEPLEVTNTINFPWVNIRTKTITTAIEGKIESIVYKAVSRIDLIPAEIDKFSTEQIKTQLTLPQQLQLVTSCPSNQLSPEEWKTFLRHSGAEMQEQALMLFLSRLLKCTRIFLSTAGSWMEDCSSAIDAKHLATYSMYHPLLIESSIFFNAIPIETPNLEAKAFTELSGLLITPLESLKKLSPKSLEQRVLDTQSAKAEVAKKAPSKNSSGIIPNFFSWAHPSPSLEKIQKAPNKNTQLKETDEEDVVLIDEIESLEEPQATPSLLPSSSDTLPSAPKPNLASIQAEMTLQSASSTIGTSTLQAQIQPQLISLPETGASSEISPPKETKSAQTAVKPQIQIQSEIQKQPQPQSPRHAATSNAPSKPQQRSNPHSRKGN
jgi:hypothetical protein